MKKILTSLILIVVLLAGGIAFGIIQDKKAKMPTSTVEMDLNPGATFVVNSKNVVLSVAYTNEDADLIYSDIKVVGRSIEEVARDFAQKAIEASSTVKEYIDLDVSATSGADENCITITVSGNKEQCEALKNSLVAKVNGVFDENGIFGRAVADIKTQTTDLATKYASLAQKFKLDASEFANKTEAEILAMINDHGKKLEGLTSNALESVENFINSYVLEPLKQLVESLEDDINDAQIKILNKEQEIAERKQEIADWQEQLKEYPALQESLQPSIDWANNQILSAEEYIAGKKQTLAEKKAELKETHAKIEQKILEKIAELRETAKQRFEDLKATLNERIEEHKTALNAYRAEFEANKEARLAEIKAWRESFNTPSQA